MASALHLSGWVGHQPGFRIPLNRALVECVVPGDTIFEVYNRSYGA